MAIAPSTKEEEEEAAAAEEEREEWMWLLSSTRRKNSMNGGGMGKPRPFLFFHTHLYASVSLTCNGVALSHLFAEEE